MTLAAVLVAVSMLAPTAGVAQPAPASWKTKDGRWNDWKDGTFATSEAQYKALVAAAGGGVRHTKLTAPDWSGLWTVSRQPGWGAPAYQNAPGTPVREGGGPPGAPPPPASAPRPERPILTPAYQKMLEDELGRVARGVQWDYLSACLPAGFPRWYTEPFMREFIVTPAQTWMINEEQGEVRRIYTDGRGHVPVEDRYPLFDGDSIGVWDGDTLIVHTVNVKAGNWNRSQPEYSDKMETVELIKKNADGRIETRMTAYDPESLQKPWHVIFGSAPVDLKSAPNLRIDVWSCNENNNVVKSADGASQLILPGEAGYKDPNTIATTPPKE
jgi:hypothetical protein